MTELNALLALQDAWPVQPEMYVSSLELSADNKLGNSFVIGECDRNHPANAIKTIFRSFAIIRRERPDVVLTTGSMPLALFSLVAKLYGAQIIWIDSISQIDRISVSGKLVKPFVDLFLVQWPELAVRYKSAQYAGELV